ncbi:MAG: DUF4286 family protein [Chitinophagaceae bacterium]
MITYNVTVKADRAIADNYVKWLKEEHIPGIIKTGCFTHGSIFHLLEADDDEGITYAIQYHAKNIDHYKNYIANFADEMRKKAADKWGHQCIAFRTVMQSVN